MNATTHPIDARPASRLTLLATQGVALLIGLFVLFFVSSAQATAPAGTVIGNQAAATYSDSSAVVRTVTSNTVVTTVQQVASLSIAPPGAKTISIGGQVYYPHTLTNTGNGTDTFQLTSTNGGGFNFASAVFYADANGDGVPDNGVPITSTGQLAAGQSLRFVAAGIVPSTALAGSTNTLVITAASVFAPATTATLSNVTTITAQAVVNVTQVLDVTAGPSPSTSNRTITISYTNTGNTMATNLVLTEAIPSGMSYIGASARWSGSGATVLSDLDATDNQGGIVYDQNISAANRVTATIASIPPGASGTLSFKVGINAGLPAGNNAATAATASFVYHDGATTVPTGNSNTVQYTVLSGAGVAITGATVPTGPQGGVVNFTNTVTNSGNATDSFDLGTVSSSFPAGTTFQFFQADGVTPITDHNGNGSPDTGPLAAGASVNIVVRAILPPEALNGGPFTVVVKATSSVDTSKSATANDTLGAISANTVDLTNNSAGAAAPGFGPGPEAAAVSTASVPAGGTTRITLVVANGSSVADSFALRASTDQSFATLALPSGWTVVFKDANGGVLDNTGVVNAGATRTVYADVTVPANAAAGTTQLFFRAQSATTGASDVLHNAVLVGTVRSLAISPNNTAQLTPGGTAVYTHTLANTGNVTEADGAIGTAAATTSDSASGFSSVVYWDKNNDGLLDTSDPVITDLSQMTGGTNGANVTAGLAPGHTARLFVKVTAPAAASGGAVNITTLRITMGGVNGGLAAPAAVSATDTSTVIASQVTLAKTQALDANCDGVADTAFSPVAIVSGAAPGGCLRYEITATNIGPAAVTNLVISGATPAYTTYSATVPASATAGTVTAPATGTRGTIQVTVPSLAPGATAVVRFGVRIDP